MTFDERLNAYKEARAKLREMEEATSHADFELSEIIREGNWKANLDRIDAARAKRDAAAEPIPAAKLRAAILKDNARRAFFEEMIPEAVAVLQKYNGKPYGEKTRRKIADEMHEKTGFYCYISSNRSSSKIQFTTNDYGRNPWSYEDLEAYFYHPNGDEKRKPLLIDNKINTESAAALSAYGIREYIEDTEAQAEKIKAAHAAALEAWNAWSAAASAYNDLIPTGAQEIDTRAGKPYSII